MCVSVQYIFENIFKIYIFIYVIICGILHRALSLHGRILEHVDHNLVNVHMAADGGPKEEVPDGGGGHLAQAG